MIVDTRELDEVRALAEELGEAADRMEKKLAANLAALAELRAQLADKEALKAAAIAELEASGQKWPFELRKRDRRSEIAAV